MNKAFYATIALLVVLAAGLTSNSTPARAATDRADKFQVVLRGDSGGPWRAWLFGADCKGSVTVEKGDRPNDPVVVSCSGGMDGEVVNPDDVDTGAISHASVRKQ